MMFALHKASIAIFTRIWGTNSMEAMGEGSIFWLDEAAVELDDSAITQCQIGGIDANWAIFGPFSVFYM